MRRILGFLGVALLLGVFAVGFFAYFVFSFDPQSGIPRDGLGRQLTDSPWFVRLIFGKEKQWAGWL